MTVGQAYLFLAIAIGFGLVGAAFTKASKGLTILKPSILCILGYTGCYYFFGHSLEKINVGVGYATWGSVGIVITSIICVLFYHEHITKRGIISLIIIVISTITLNLFGNA